MSYRRRAGEWSTNNTTQHNTAWHNIHQWTPSGRWCCHGVGRKAPPESPKFQETWSVLQKHSCIHSHIGSRTEKDEEHDRHERKIERIWRILCFAKSIDFLSLLYSLDLLPTHTYSRSLQKQSGDPTQTRFDVCILFWCSKREGGGGGEWGEE